MRKTKVAVDQGDSSPEMESHMETNETIEEAIREEAGSDFFLRAAQRCLLVLVVLLPVWFLPTTINPVVFNKAFLVSFLTLLSVLLYLAHAVVHGKIVLPTHRVFILVGLVLLVWLVSALTASQTLMSFVGSGSDTSSVWSMLSFLLMTMMIGILFADHVSYIRLLKSFAMGIALLLVSMVFFFFGGGKLFGNDFREATFNTVGSWRSVALVVGFLVILLYPLLLRARARHRLKLLGLFIASLCAIMVVNFPFAWGVIGFFGIIFLSYVIWQRNISPAILGISLLLLTAPLFGFFARDFIGTLFDVPIPLEVNVAHRTTFGLVKSSLQEHLLLGGGPASFTYLWDRFRPLEVNQTPFWNVRFATGSSYFLTLLAEVGFLGFGSFIALLLSLWYFAMRGAMNTSIEHHRSILLAFILMSYTMVVWALYPVGFVLVAMGFVVLGFVFASLRLTGAVGSREVVLFREGPTGFIAALLLVFLMIVGVSGIYMVGTRYLGQIMFSRGLTAFNVRGNVDDSERIMNSALRLDSHNAAYYRSLSQLAMVRAQRVLSNPSAGGTTSRDLVGSQFANALDQAIRFGQSSINISPGDFENYQSLGRIYQFLVPLNAQGALAAALTQYDKASALAPTNPALWKNRAEVLFAEANRVRSADAYRKTEEALEKAIALKSNYTDAHFLFAQVLDAQGNETEAIRRAEAAAIIVPNDIGSLFQLGFLYYKAGRLSDAERVLARAIELNTNYSNARYFLGLVYDRTGRHNQAIEEFGRIAELNPGNTEVQTVLANLRAGRAALSGLAGQAPENRATPPLDETKPIRGIR